MPPSPITKMFREYPAEQWCFSWWHKVRYGSLCKEEQLHPKILSVEYFCKKCQKKTDEYTHYGSIEHF